MTDLQKCAGNDDNNQINAQTPRRPIQMPTENIAPPMVVQRMPAETGSREGRCAAQVTFCTKMSEKGVVQSEESSGTSLISVESPCQLYRRTKTSRACLSILEM
jgi:hypothetical protein